MHQRPKRGHTVDVLALNREVVDAVGAGDAVEALDHQRAVDAKQCVACCEVDGRYPRLVVLAVEFAPLQL